MVFDGRLRVIYDKLYRLTDSMLNNPLFNITQQSKIFSIMLYLLKVHSRWPLLADD